MFTVFSLPVILSSLLISAHFYRAGILPLSLVCLLFPLLLLSRNRWIPRLLTMFLLLSATEWLRTMLFFIEQYQDAGHSWTRLAIILTSVSLFTAFSALVFRTTPMKKRYMLPLQDSQ
jgi:hypothetical protein